MQTPIRYKTISNNITPLDEYSNDLMYLTRRSFIKALAMYQYVKHSFKIYVYLHNN